MSNTNDTEKTRELNDAELAAVSGGAASSCTQIFGPCPMPTISPPAPSGGGLVHEPIHAK